VTKQKETTHKITHFHRINDAKPFKHFTVHTQVGAVYYTCMHVIYCRGSKLWWSDYM